MGVFVGWRWGADQPTILSSSSCIVSVRTSVVELHSPSRVVLRVRPQWQETINAAPVTCYLVRGGRRMASLLVFRFPIGGLHDVVHADADRQGIADHRRNCCEALGQVADR